MMPRDEEDMDLFAAEYVLGTLEAREVMQIEAALAGDPRLREAVQRWQHRLAALNMMPTVESVPPELWSRIERSLAERRVGAIVTPIVAARKPFVRPGLWRGWAFGSTALAAGLAAFLWMRPAPERLTTVLLSERDQPAWLVEARGGALQLAALNPRPVDPSRVLQLWALPQGATAPTSLGLIPPSGQFSVTPGGITPSAGMLVEITLEPPGGSTTGRPTGPVLFIGRLSPVSGS
ncbi:anti-sigma factor domain-containing protein [Pseudoroseomonas globiformis]|uniref:Regulator of SigK n=1 Tax=Teichococcus globiformis TaxID=2307229 RepID=A0ABV7G477_9PROT